MLTHKMNHPIAQFVQLTCYANAALRGRIVPAFYPGNSTCRFCDAVEFNRPSRDGPVNAQREQVANTPDAWYRHLEATGVLRVRLSRTPPGFPERAALLGGAETWGMEAVQRDQRSTRWTSRWEVWNQHAPERRVWRVTLQPRRGAPGRGFTQHRVGTAGGPPSRGPR